MQTAITQSTIEGRDYFTTVRNGVEYVAMRNGGDAWGVATRRLALGRYNTGGFKHFATLEALCAGCKAFAGLDAMLVATTSH